MAIDVTEYPIEFPKKAVQILQRKEETTQLKNTRHLSSGIKTDHEYSYWKRQAK